jgi:hypothetical protein
MVIGERVDRAAAARPRLLAARRRGGRAACSYATPLTR